MITWISIDDSGYSEYKNTKGRCIGRKSKKERGPSSHHLTVFSLLGISDVARYVPHQLSSLTLLPSPKESKEEGDKAS